MKMTLYEFRDYVKPIYDYFFKVTPGLKKIYETKGTSNEITILIFIMQKIVGFNRFAKWPTHYSSQIFGLRWITIGINTAPGRAFGCYIFAKEDSPISIGNYTAIAPNVGIVGFNHDVYDISTFDTKGGVKIGNYCWIGMNSVILPGVVLGNHTTVAAGSVVTKSFENGYCIVGGNPAKLIKNIDKDKVNEHRDIYEYIGYKKIK
jgi:acetyltransferase-like isoleucine patch superfamily enzyme